MKRKLAAFASALMLMFCVTPVKAAGDGIVDGSFDDGIYSAVVKLPDDSMEIKTVTADGRKLKITAVVSAEDMKLMLPEDEQDSGNEVMCLVKAKLDGKAIGDGGVKKIVMTFGNGEDEVVYESEVDTGDQRYAAAERSLVRTRIILAVVVAAVIIGGALFFVNSRRKKNAPASLKEDVGPVQNYTVPLARKREGNAGTVLNAMSTRILFRESAEKKIVLTNIADKEHVIEISSLKPSVIGRNQSLADAVIYNERSVSQKHCRIFCRNSKVYVEDLDSLNHTFVDGEQITEETELFSGSVLKIGRISFSVRIENV